MMFLQVSGVSAISNLQTIKVVVENQYNYSGFAKKILSENKTSSFTMRNNTCCKVLMIRKLCG